MIRGQQNLFSFFIDLKNKYDDSSIIGLFENYEISKLDIHRMYRYLEKYTKENSKTPDDETVEEEIEEEGGDDLLL